MISVRYFRWSIPLTVAVSLVLGASVAKADSVADAVQRAKESVVGVGTYDVRRAPSSRLMGTGFAVADGLHILTNVHVIPVALDEAKREQLVVFVGQGERPEVREAIVVAKDVEHDLAVLSVKGPPIPVMALGDSGGVREGDGYIFTGFPIGAVLGLYPVTHRAMISSITPIAVPAGQGRQLSGQWIRRLEDPYRVFQLDGTAYPGNSGGPLYDPATGVVVGVVNMTFVKETKEAILEHPSGISYAIPIQFAKALLGGVLSEASGRKSGGR